MIQDTNRFVREAGRSQGHRTNLLTVLLAAGGLAALALVALLGWAVRRRTGRLFRAAETERAAAEESRALPRHAGRGGARRGRHLRPRPAVPAGQRGPGGDQRRGPRGPRRPHRGRDRPRRARGGPRRPPAAGAGDRRAGRRPRGQRSDPGRPRTTTPLAGQLLPHPPGADAGRADRRPGRLRGGHHRAQGGRGPAGAALRGQRRAGRSPGRRGAARAAGAAARAPARGLRHRRGRRPGRGPAAAGRGPRRPGVGARAAGPAARGARRRAQRAALPRHRAAARLAHGRPGGPGRPARPEPPVDAGAAADRPGPVAGPAPAGHLDLRPRLRRGRPAPGRGGRAARGRGPGQRPPLRGAARDRPDAAAEPAAAGPAGDRRPRGGGPLPLGGRRDRGGRRLLRPVRDERRELGRRHRRRLRQGPAGRGADRAGPLHHPRRRGAATKSPRPSSPRSTRPSCASAATPGS